MGLRIGLWGWLACLLQSRTVPNLSVTPRLLWKWFFRYRTYIPYRYYSGELKAYVQTKTCARMFIATLFTIALKWKQTTQMFLNEQIAKQNTFYQYNGRIVFGHKNEQSTDICYTMSEPWNHSAKWKKPDTKCHMLCDSVYEMLQNSPIFKDRM